jgi:hypothetical protein
MTSHDRTVKAFVEEIWHLTGERLKIGWGISTGLSLTDETTGAAYWLGGHTWQVLSPSRQESICRGLGREEWVVLLGLRPADAD